MATSQKEGKVRSGKLEERMRIRADEEIPMPGHAADEMRGSRGSLRTSREGVQATCGRRRRAGLSFHSSSTGRGIKALNLGVHAQPSCPSPVSAQPQVPEALGGVTRRPLEIRLEENATWRRKSGSIWAKLASKGVQHPCKVLPKKDQRVKCV